MKYEDLKCEFCDGVGEREVNIDGADCPVECSFCNSTGIDSDQLNILFQNSFGSKQCALCGCGYETHNQDKLCPIFHAGSFYGYAETKFHPA